MARGRLLQPNKPTWAHSRTCREKLLEGEVFARPSSLSTGPLTNLSAAFTALPHAIRQTFLNRKFAYLFLWRNIVHSNNRDLVPGLKCDSFG